MSDFDDARKLLEDDGYVVLKKKSHAHLLRKLHSTEALLRAANEHAKRNQAWVDRLIGPEMRFLRERVEFLYGTARAHGATAEELASQPGMMTYEEQREALGLPPLEG